MSKTYLVIQRKEFQYLKAATDSKKDQPRGRINTSVAATS